MTKWKLGVFAAGGCAVAAVVVTLVLLLGKESYRTILVEEVNGTTVVVNEENQQTNAYEGMHFYSGEDVEVQAKSDMTMCLDMDKYVYAEEGTRFYLEATGREGQGRTVIRLYEGSELNRLKNPLGESESYEVDTPNSTMAVRGTVFRVLVWTDENGMVYTSVEVYEGAVRIDLKTVDGKNNGVTETFHAGEAALIRGNSDFSEFVTGEEGSIKRGIAYKEIPQAAAAKLVEFIDDGEELCIGKELLMDYTRLAEHDMKVVSVAKEPTCTEEGIEETRCAICNEVAATESIPKLAHTEAEEWTVVTEPACEEAGVRQLKCAVCQQVLKEEIIPATGHIPGDWEVTKEATCTADGSRRRLCSVCGVTVDRQGIPASGHSAGDWEVTKEATCTACGSQRKVCSVCGAVAETGEIPASGHTTGGFEVTKAATCTETGSRRKVCSVCGAVAETEVIPASGHTPGNWNVLREATCTADGSRSRTCSICGTMLGTETIAKLEHKVFPIKATKDATCTENGTGEGMCTLCNGMITVDIPATGHKLSYVHRLGKQNADGTFSSEYIEKCANYNCTHGSTLATDHVITMDKSSGTTVYKCSICSGQINVTEQ